MIEVTLFLFNLFLVVIIISAYVKLSYLIKQQGLQISVLLKAEKEGFAAAQRYTRAQKLSDMPNGLMPSWKQPEPKKNKIREEASSKRGDVSFDYLKSGKNAVADIKVEDKTVPDTSQLPAETQTGVLSSETTEQFGFATNPRATPSFLTSVSTFAPTKSL